jgi:hypothetical protein
MMRTVMLALFVWCFQMTMAQAGVYDLSEQSRWKDNVQPYYRGYARSLRHMTMQERYANQSLPRRSAAAVKPHLRDDRSAEPSDMAWVGAPAPSAPETSVWAEHEEHVMTASPGYCASAAAQDGPCNNHSTAPSDMAWVGVPAPSVREISVSAERELIAPPGNCVLAAAQGGPCGCVVANMLGLPRDYKDLNLWLADDWQHAGPRTVPHLGAVAIWPGRHVELVSAVNPDGSISTRGSVGFSHIDPSHLVFIELRGRYPTADGIAWQNSGFSHRTASRARYFAGRSAARTAYTGRYAHCGRWVRTSGGADCAD